MKRLSERLEKLMMAVTFAEAGEHDTDPNIYYINFAPSESLVMPSDMRQPLVTASGELPRPPKYSIAEEGWKKVAVPVMAAAIGGAFLVQAVYFTKQLIQGEKEFEE